MSDSNTDEVVIRREGRAGRITLNRPKAFNALTLGMVRSIWQTLLDWQKDAAIELVLLDGAGERGLCAGGDVRSLYDSHRTGSSLARTFWQEEYRLNALIHRYPKPYVSLMDGIVMGGGIGLSAHGAFRIVTEKSQLAMPETSIGLIPDVGGTYLLSRAQGQLGVYLGLIGERMNGSDAIQVGFASTFLPSDRLAALVARLVDPAGGPVDEVISECEDDISIPASPLAAQADLINRHFGFGTVEEIAASLNTTTHSIAQKAREELLKRSPLALKTTLAAIHRARRLPTLEEALNVEFRLCTRLFENGEFIEGVRALLVDKDRQPKWRPPTLSEVSDTMVADLFAPMPAAEELGLRPPA